MAPTGTIHGVLLSDTFDLKTFYKLDFEGVHEDVRLLNPDEVEDPAAIRFAVCWLPGPDAFAPYPNLEMAMSVGAGVDDLLAHDGLGEDIAICRVRDPYQAELMAGFAAHEVLHLERDFPAYAADQAKATWNPLPLRPPHALKIAVLGHGSMGAAVTRALAVLGFSVSVACRRPPATPIEGVTYCTGESAISEAASGADVLINVLPLTPETHGILARPLFDKVAPGCWLIQIGRGEHLNEADFTAALEGGQLKGASLDVFATEPLPAAHAFWSDPRIRITPHIASDTTPHIVCEQALQSARDVLAGKRPSLAVDRVQGY
ncbi:NAD(P)-dependent oxidoreductase [Novosphingobium decolorationis]|uniref:Hydroxyacid dehydrogenase n=1 Tax=Novosphingobium decolorationis TaxID=2698673 RepID=A0ABX8E8F9_9SPHN|nr:NAD(P)-dependent oxidoreductase [Novosphingobium decolorationis]QVM85297.1 hydroxyacid dehydrogenase [Novosphingobium decolorationis]